MIDDGYTQEWESYHYRPLTQSGRDIVQRFVSADDWEGLGNFLWQQPRVFIESGRFPLPTEQRNRLFALMMSWETETTDLQNLKVGVELILTHPLLAMRTCEMCKTWWFDEDTGLVVQDERGPAKRPKHAVVACDSSIGCLKGHHSDPSSALNEKNERAWKHFLDYRHVGLSEIERECPILRANWRVMGNLVEKHGLPSVCH